MEHTQVLLWQGPSPLSLPLKKHQGGQGSFPFKSAHSASAVIPACFRPSAVINSLALNVCPSLLLALWAVSLMCIPRSAVTRSGAMELHCHSCYLSPELTSWKHQSAPAAANIGGVPACPAALPHWPPFLVWQVPSSVSCSSCLTAKISIPPMLTLSLLSIPYSSSEDPLTFVLFIQIFKLLNYKREC